MEYAPAFRLDGNVALATAARGRGCAVLYLATDASRWVTGSEPVIDGGYTAA